MEEILNIKTRFELINNHLDEKTKRLLCAAEAKVLGYGGIKKVHNATHVSPKTISRGLKETGWAVSSSCPYCPSHTH
jgi:hypothetical protein